MGSILNAKKRIKDKRKKNLQKWECAHKRKKEREKNKKKKKKKIERISTFFLDRRKSMFEWNTGAYYKFVHIIFLNKRKPYDIEFEVVKKLVFEKRSSRIQSIYLLFVPVDGISERTRRI